MTNRPKKIHPTPSHRKIVNSLRDCAVYLLDPEGIIKLWHPEAHRIYGFTARDVVGRHFSLLYPSDIQATGEPARILATARETSHFEAEGWRLRKDGERIWIRIAIDRITDKAGRCLGFAMLARDCTVEHLANMRQIEEERRFRHLVQGVTDYAIYMLSPQGVITNWNAGAEKAKGYMAGEIIGQHFSRFFRPEDREAGLPQRALNKAITDGRFEAEGWRVRKDGTQFWAHVIIDVIHDDFGALIGFAKVTRDVTRQKADADRILEITRTLDSALSNMKHGLCVFDDSETLRLANRRFLKLFGRETQDGLIGMSFNQIVHDVILKMEGSFTASTEVKAFWERHRQLIRDNSTEAIVEYFPEGTSLAIAHSSLPDGSWITTFEDVTERTKAEALVATLASTDSLTDLANRRTFGSRLKAMISGASATNPVSIFLIDLDDFKGINDKYGHAVGDKVLMHVATCLRSCISNSGLAARLGGDEFALILDSSCSARALAVAEGLIDSIHSMIEIVPGISLQIGMSIGFSTIDSPDAELDGVLGEADLALYEAKAAGKCSARRFSREMGDKAKARRELEQDLRFAVETGAGFTLHYQPIVCTKTGDIKHREALLRWEHPRQGTVSPSTFIPLAEQYGVIRPLGRWVLEQACRDAATWGGGACVAINVSPMQLGDGEFPRQVARVLAETNLPARCLEVEITETAVLDDNPGKLLDLHHLHNLGVRVALDDFGVGFACLTHLRAFPFDRIKIDGSFVRDALERPTCAAIVATIADLGRRLGIVVVAEGIETEAHLLFAREQGCQEAQGYFLGRPAPFRPSSNQAVAA